VTAQDRVVLVVGPRLAGVGAIAAAVRRQLPDVVVVEPDRLPKGRAPDAVLAVVSAVAPMTRSDWEPIERAAARTDLVIGVVSKVDAHRGWRDVMAANRTLVAGWHARLASMPWLGTAAAPDLGEARIDELVAVLRERLADPDLEPRNQLRANEFRKETQLSPTRPVVVTRTDAVMVRHVLQRTRLGLLRFTRDRCLELRAELRDAASAMGAGGSTAFEKQVGAEAERFHVELADEIDRAVAAAASEVAIASRLEPGHRQDPPEVDRAPSSSRRLEGRLMAVLGVGFGLGIALALSRLLAGLAPGLSAAGSAVGAAAGLALVVWVVRARRLLHDRALLDRWVVEVCSTLRWHGEAMVAERLLVAESRWVAARRRSASSQAHDAAGGDPKWIREDVTEQYEWC
jgi:hypothetical protein